MKIGFIGLGVMGSPMARHLANAGHEIATTLNRSPLPEGIAARVLPAPAEVAEASEIVILMLPDTPDVERVLLGDRGVLAGLRPGSLVIDMSTISPIATRRFADTVGQKGGSYLDAPVSGGQVGAENATLTIMVGGAEADFDRALPLFQIMGKNITLVGATGAGQTCKLANQIIVALTIEAVSEALVFASKAGCDPARVRQALMGGFAASRVLEVHGERMIKRSFAPGFRLKLHQKDLTLALDSAKSLGVALPNTATAQELMSACDREQDHSSLVKALEALASHRLG
ncbi:2-hydroxy-3-oxopropionate reductase [Tabrizicola sp.]|uniref:2-hydroxy-3-oxopropionate reductase n=1 Tax=Tabrizicola sp. TaxID=2005166 RepID=UPI001A511D5E|nr:2-hydroxy-3-oxopropionate reductase [Tabrizicola sp.]MBL9075482.1 2-hydroxy-3-oxopropionate reductase [Tabrizicola sp.]